ncbi:MAG: CCA tRNA nucleotidyltransferase, partial [Chloroflexi bacterium]|nr:CCA tRNA nucleotidyltransferase [Chloroflexota bacterium]
DLQTGKIRVLHALSFVDDATRMLRAVRFAVRFDFEIEERTLELMGDSMALIGELSGARLYHELSLILNEPKSVAMLDRLNALGILAAIGASLPWDKAAVGRLETLNEGLEKQFTANPEMAQDSLNMRQIFSYCLWLEGLAEPSLKQVSKRLRMQARLTDSIRQTGRLRGALPGLVGRPVSEAVRELEKYHAIPLQAVRVSTSNLAERELIERYLEEWQSVKPVTTGKELRKLGIPPSDYYEKVLSALRGAWLDGKVNTPEAEANLLKRLLEER